jgi:hypothetical protein
VESTFLKSGKCNDVDILLSDIVVVGWILLRLDNVRPRLQGI